MRPLKLAVIGTFQLALGLVFLVAPARACAALGVTPASTLPPDSLGAAR